MSKTLSIQQVDERESTSIRERLMSAALPLFCAEGIDAVSVARICREAALANGTFYTVYRTKDDLVGDILETAHKALAVLLDEAGREELPAEAAHRRDVTLILDYVDRHQALFEFALGQRVRGHDRRNPIYIFANQRRAEMQRRIDAGQFRSDLDPTIATYAEIGLMTEVLAWWVASGKTMDRKVLIEQLTAIRTGATT